MSDDQQLPSAPPLSGYEVPATRGAAPQPVRLAAIGVFVLALLNLVGIAVAVGSRSRIVDQLHKSSTQLTDSQLNTAATISIAFSVVISVLFAVLLVWLGVKTLAGRNWARVTVTVLLVLGLLSGLYSLVRSGGPVALVLDLITLVVSVAVLVLLWGPAAARAYYAKRPAA
jgi:F0F1-type ATP synthase assembly protein I